MRAYDHTTIETKWRKAWIDAGVYKTTEDASKKKFYILDMFPYPSGAGLHVGHPKGYIATDIISRYKKMQGFNVLHPMGWDAFGLPAEQHALKNKVHPKINTDENIARYKEQLEAISLNYDWNREISTTDPEFYKWTQWAFIQMFKKGLVVESNEPINWCPSCMTGLANEDLEDGKCERCGSDIEKKPLRQWIIKITDYAERLLADLDTLDWQEHIKALQRNWIGKSEGALIEFTVTSKQSTDTVGVFTTRPDTLLGATYMVLAPEHPLVEQLADSITNIDEVRAYIHTTSKKSEIDRTDMTKEKTGVELRGIQAINPANEEEIPVYIADYVLADYGTGAIMAVPAHDERDREFAQKFNLPSRIVIDENTDVIAQKKEMTKRFGTHKVSYKLRDWVFARQRYWGEPIPLIHCEKCGVVPVPESELPVRLPDVESYEPTGTGESPLANITEWVHVSCPECGGAATRETNTMPQWAGSSWYYLRYIDPHNETALVDTAKEKYWSPVDFYVGGAEHATRHLIYARFWHKFLYDIGIVAHDEPFKKLQTVGLIMAEDGRKMSKRWGNVINPDDVIKEYGADTFRTYEMFMSPFDQSASWSTQGLMGPRRFMERVWKAQEKVSESSPALVTQHIHKAIKKTGEDIEQMKYNTAISEMMITLNAIYEAGSVGRHEWEMFLKILSPFAPHITQELWCELGHTNFLLEETWPTYDPTLLVEDTVTIAVQVNGKVRAEISVPKDADEAFVRSVVFAHEGVSKWLNGATEETVRKFVYVTGRIANIVL